jgi:hypothetical protein
MDTKEYLRARIKGVLGSHNTPNADLWRKMTVYKTNKICHPRQVNDDLNGDDISSSMYSCICPCGTLNIDLGLKIEYPIESATMPLTGSSELSSETALALTKASKSSPSIVFASF